MGNGTLTNHEDFLDHLLFVDEIKYSVTTGLKVRILVMMVLIP